MSRQMSVSGKKHWTAATASQVYDKINRYTFLEKNSILVDNAKRAKNIREIEFPSENMGLFAVRFNSDSTKIVASYGTGAIQLIDVDMRTPLCYIKPPADPAFPIMSMRFNGPASERFFAAGICGNIYVCKLEQNYNRIFAKESPNEINAIDVDQSADMLATGGKDGALRLYDTNTGTVISKLQKLQRNDESTSFHTRRIFALKFHPKRQHTLLSGGWDDCVKVWDTRSKDGCVKNINGPHICGDALDIKDNVILTGQWTAENSLQLWDFTTGKLISNVSPTNRVQTLDGEFFYCCQFFSTAGYADAMVAGGSGTGYLDVINVADERIICTFKSNKVIQTLDTCGPSSKVAFGGMENVLRIANITVLEKNLLNEYME